MPDIPMVSLHTNVAVMVSPQSLFEPSFNTSQLNISRCNIFEGYVKISPFYTGNHEVALEQ